MRSDQMDGADEWMKQLATRLLFHLAHKVRLVCFWFENRPILRSISHERTGTDGRTGGRRDARHGTAPAATRSVKPSETPVETKKSIEIT